MIHLTYSNRTEALLEALVRRLDARRRRGDDPLAPICLVVPNRNVERYVELGVARSLGIAANLRFQRLAGFVREWLTPPGSELLLDTRLTAQVLRGFLDETLLAHPALAPVRRYLAGARVGPDAVDLRRAQLALHLAHLFEEYSFSRPELLTAWQKGHALFSGAAQATTEAWQSEIYRWMRTHPTGARTLTLAEALQAAPTRAPAEELHVFGLSYVARIFSNIFGALGERANLYLYALNPCEEFWEDLETEGELRRRRRSSDAEPEWLFEDDDPFRLSVETESPLLRLWGRPGREHVRLLGALTDCDFEASFVDPVDPASAAAGETDAGVDPLFARLSRPSLLARVQQDILQRAPRREDAPDAPRDESLQVFECPNVRREVETVAAEIWSLIETLDDLSFDQIAVLVNGPDRDLYLPHLASVFEEAHGIPYNVADLSLASVSPVVEGALALLALPTTRFTRPDVLAVATHPSVRARVPNVDGRDWIDLCDRLGVFHGLDHEAHEGTYVGDEDLLSWEQGLTRIALGAFMTGPRSGDERFVEVAPHRYLPEEPALSDATDARFALLVRSLMSDVRFARSAELTLAEWARFLSALLAAYLTPTDGREEAAMRKAARAVESLRALDLDGTRVRYTVAHELAKSALEELAGGRGQQLADGVAISSLMPMRAIPFRVIFVLGLGEGRFPANDRRDSMDLRAARRQVGDVTPPERDRYTFLETLLCARERLYLTYVGRDEQTGDRLSPSTVVSELLEAVERGYLPDADRIVVRPKLRRHDEPLVSKVLPEAAHERRARALGDALASSLERAGHGALLASAGAARASRRVAGGEALAEMLLLPPLPEHAPREATEATVRISLAALRRFLECPLQGWTQTVLRLSEAELDSAAAAADEPFTPAFLDETILLRAAFVDSVLSEHPMEEVYAQRVAVLKARGRWPVGALERLAATRHGEVLNRWSVAWAALGPAQARGRVRFGAAQSAETVEEVLDPLVLVFDDDPRDPGSGRRLRVELSGRTELIRAEGTTRASVSALVRRASGERGRLDELRYGLRAFFDHAALTAASRGEIEHRSVQLLGDRDAPPSVVRFEALEVDAARRWLRDLVRDLLVGSHAYLFPVEAVLRLADRFDAVRGEDFVESVEVVRERFAGGQSRFGPVRDALAYEAPEPGRAEEIAERRFGLPIRAMRELATRRATNEEPR